LLSEEVELTNFLKRLMSRGSPPASEAPDASDDTSRTPVELEYREEHEEEILEARREENEGAP
jgi:hypothetical protein